MIDSFEECELNASRERVSKSALQQQRDREICLATLRNGKFYKIEKKK